MILLAPEGPLAPLTMAVSITRLPVTRPLLTADHVRRRRSGEAKDLSLQRNAIDIPFPEGFHERILSQAGYGIG
jgi:hypothetical protein